MKPGSRPLEELAAQLSPVLYSEGDRLTGTRQLLDNLSADGRALHLAVRLAWAEAATDQYLFLVIDQFEEIFTHCHDESERRRFIDNLLYAVSSQGKVIILLTMRADFYHRCAAYRELAGQISAQQVLVGPMNEAELRRAIERPAQQVGLHFEPGLVDTILADVAQQPGALPLLQHALLELWERRERDTLTLQAYQASGGVAGAIAQRAETLYAEFSLEEQAIVRRVMLRLTQPGEGTEDTRRRARLRELVSTEGQTGEVSETSPVLAVIHRMADARLLTTTRDAASSEEMVDVAHEALIRGWDRLREWIDEDRAALRIHRRLTEDAQEWDRHGRDSSYRYRGARLTAAQEWAQTHDEDLSPLEREFLGKRRWEQAEKRLFLNLWFVVPLFGFVLYSVNESYIGRMIFSCKSRGIFTDTCSQPYGWLMLLSIIILTGGYYFGVRKSLTLLKYDWRLAAIFLGVFLMFPASLIILLGPAILVILETPGF